MRWLRDGPLFVLSEFREFLLGIIVAEAVHGFSRYLLGRERYTRIMLEWPMAMMPYEAMFAIGLIVVAVFVGHRTGEK
jgi:hypothetical protein